MEDRQFFCVVTLGGRVKPGHGEWALHWKGLGTFEIIPVVTGKETREVVEKFLPKAP